MLRRVLQRAFFPFTHSPFTHSPSARTPHRHSAGRHRDERFVAARRLKRLGLVAAATVVALVGGGLVAAPALAAQASLSVTKTVEGKSAISVQKGAEFTYTIIVGCDDNDCLDAKLVDRLPAQFAGFSILDTSVKPASGVFTKTLTGCDTTVTADCALTVDFADPLGAGVGIRAGDTYRVMVTLKAPQDLQPSWAYNGVAVTNTAVGTSSTAAQSTGSADVTVTIPVAVDTAVGKTWTPASQQYQPGAASTIALSQQNTSNVPASTLVLQEPATAADGATALDAGNPFALVDLAGIGPVTLPQGAATVQVDAYVFDSASGKWVWKTGPPVAGPAVSLPADVDPADVAGLRFTFASASGATIAASGTAGAVTLTVDQRSANRISGASLVGGATVTNKASGTVTVPDQSPVTKTAQAPFTVGGLTVAVDAGKTISPARIPAGTSATATITGKNTSNGTLSKLTLSDLDYFSDKLLFGGFSAPLSYPSGATGATVTWHFSDGSTSTEAFADGATPVAPTAPDGEHLTGIELAYSGAIAAGAVANAQFAISPTADFAPAGGSKKAPNTLSVTGVNAAGSATKPASAPLEVFYPDIKLQLAKKISPTGAVSPGATVVAQLPATTSTDTAYVRPDRIVIEDVWRQGQDDDFFNAFNPLAIAPTQVPLGSTLTVQYTTDDGATWTTLAVVDATAAAQIYRDNLPADQVTSITGLRFTFENPAGFAQGTTVSPAITAQARADLRDGGDPTSVADAGPSTYRNHATADTTGAVKDAPPITGATATADANAAIQTTGGAGAGSLGADKRWTKADLTGDVTSLDSQSAEQAGTLLSWGVTDTGYSSVTVSDPASDEDNPAATVFQAFDLVKIAPVTFTAQPLLKWDTVSLVQLRIGGAWVTVAAPGGNWMNGTGFKGYTLTAQQSADATGVRIVVVPNDGARTTDPLAPPVGSGVATVAFGQSRSFGLVWQLRNVQRHVADPANPWVTEDTALNDPSAGTVWNTVAVSGVQNGNPVGPVTAEDSVSLVDHAPLVSVDKTSAKSTIVVPHRGDVDAAGYPTDDFTITAKNTAASRASYIRVSDPSPCDPGDQTACVSAPDAWGADPFVAATYTTDNPFERLDLTKIAFSVPAGQVDLDASRVTLWHRAADGTTSTSWVSMRTAQTLTEAQLADVVGVSVLYQGTDPATTGGTIASGQALTMTLSTRVRVAQRSDADAAVTSYRVDNHTFAQGYDPVLRPSGQGSQPNDADDAGLVFTTGVLGVTADKVISPAQLLERDRHTPVTVTLTATQGDATAATHQVVITDDDPAFWNSFGLTGLSASDVTLPAGADQVRVDVQTDGGPAWIIGTDGPAASLPTTALGSITGIRFTFSRADHGLLSRSAVPADFTAKAVLHVGLLDRNRDGSAVVFPSTIEDTVQTLSHRTDDPLVYADKTADDAASIALQPGTFGLDVAKDPEDGVHTVGVGDPNTWTLRFTNTGTGYLDIDALTDTLPASLAWDGENPVFATSSGGTLSASPTTSFDPDTGRLVLTWPSGGSRMAPGESATVKLGIVLKPGLTGSDRATNQFVVSTGQTLATCTNSSGNGQGVLSGLPATDCGTSNYVQPVNGPSLFTGKGVKGDVVGHTVSGAANPANPSAACRPDADGYYASPCVANTVVGGTDEWRLSATNSGTVSYDSLVFVDPLPTPGDRMLATGSDRGSSFRPVLDGDFGIVTDAPAGTTTTWEVTTAEAPCVGTGATAWPADPDCSTHPGAGEWIASTAFTGDWAAVTAIRVRLDFSTAAAHVLPAGGAVTVTYRTVDRPATDSAPDGAPVSIDAGPAVAWNQFGADAALTGGGSLHRAPVKAGVTIATGSLSIVKRVTGEAAAEAPDSFVADVACTVAGAPVDLGDAARTVLSRESGLTARIDGIPIGADCTVTEDGDAGSYGEAERTVDNGSVHIGAGLVDGEVPEAQVVTITNTFEYGQLEIAKTASTPIAKIGEPVTYTITVTNIGALDAKDLRVTDTLPEGAAFVSADQDGTEQDGVVTWPIASLPKGASYAVHVVVTYAAEGYPVNSATVTTPPSGPWQPPAVDNPCTDDQDGACSQIHVDPPTPVDPTDPTDPVNPAQPGTPGTPGASGGLASTGSTGDYLLVAFWAGILTLAGAALVTRRRRRDA